MGWAMTWAERRAEREALDAAYAEAEAAGVTIYRHRLGDGQPEKTAKYRDLYEAGLLGELCSQILREAAA